VTVIQALSQGTSSVLNITGGNFAVSSPAASIYYAFGGTVNLSSGTLEITNNGIELATGSHLNYSGGSLKIGWSFKANQSGAFLPTQGSVEFIGARNCTIECSNGNYFYDLKDQQTRQFPSSIPWHRCAGKQRPHPAGRQLAAKPSSAYREPGCAHQRWADQHGIFR
jgi:hypothetical protein